MSNVRQQDNSYFDSVINLGMEREMLKSVSSLFVVIYFFLSFVSDSNELMSELAHIGNRNHYLLLINFQFQPIPLHHTANIIKATQLLIDDKHKQTNRQRQFDYCLLLLLHFAKYIISIPK